VSYGAEDDDREPNADFVAFAGKHAASHEMTTHAS
jgi:hypothetical protein